MFNPVIWKVLLMIEVSKEASEFFRLVRDGECMSQVSRTRFLVDSVKWKGALTNALACGPGNPGS